MLSNSQWALQDFVISFGFIKLFNPFLDYFFIIFIDEILVNVKSEEDHEVHLCIVLGLLKKKLLYVKFLKCEFCLSSVSFSGQMEYKKGDMVDPQKAEAAKTRPTNVTKIYSFMGSTSYYDQFFKGFIFIASHITSLTRKEVPFM